MARTHAANVVHIVTMQSNGEVVLAVHREVMAGGNAATGAKREIIAHAVALNEQNRYLVGLGYRTRRCLAHRLSCCLACRRQVTLHQCRRDRQHIGHVVEAILGDVVCRQQDLYIYIQRQQITHGIGVFGAIEAME